MGGGVMRAAAKAAAVGGYRAAHGPWVEQAAATTARWSSRPPSAAMSVPGQVSDGVPPLSAVSPAHSAPVEAGAAARQQRVAWNMDDWEFAGGEEEEVFEAVRPAPPARLVFGPVPTLEEAKEATSDLKDAVEKLYFSPTATGLEGSVVAAGSNSLVSSRLESLEAKNRYAAILPSAPRHAMQAFSLLQGCPEAQDVVASLVSDKNVWDAVMKNEKVMEFYETHQINVPPAESSECKEESVDGDGKGMDSSVGEEVLESSENVFMAFLNSMKARVTEMVHSLTDLFKELMGTAGAKTTTNSEGNHFGMGLGSSFFALAVAAILVVVVKRSA